VTAELRPAALALLGRADDAPEALERSLGALGDRRDPAAESYRAYAERLCVELG
jgi:hypothetical protein